MAKYSQSLIKHILKQNSIVSYLKDKDIEPVKVFSDGRHTYLCPFPDHKESKPSFIVWTLAEYENFYCFGCSRHSTIIHLISEFEDLPFKSVLERLVGGKQLSLEENIDYLIKDIEKDRDGMQNCLDLSEAMNSIASMCRLYLEGVDFNEEEAKIIYGFYSEIDNLMFNFDFDSIIESSYNLPLYLFERRKKFESNKQKRIDEKIAEEYKRYEGDVLAQIR